MTRGYCYAEGCLQGRCHAEHGSPRRLKRRNRIGGDRCSDAAVQGIRAPVRRKNGVLGRLALVLGRHASLRPIHVENSLRGSVNSIPHEPPRAEQEQRNSADYCKQHGNDLSKETASARKQIIKADVSRPGVCPIAERTRSTNYECKAREAFILYCSQIAAQ